MMVGFGLFGSGTWFGYNMAAMRYDKLVAEERKTHAEVCQYRMAEALQNLDIKVCAQWNVSVPPYDASVAQFIDEKPRE